MIEDSTLSLPFLQDGLLQLGDLWDCRTSSKPIRDNIFGKPLDPKYVETHAVQTSEYRLSHVRSTSFKAKALDVSASLSIELAGGQIKLGGSASFEHSELDEYEQEELLCQCVINSFIVRARNNAVDVISTDVKDSILSGETRATHFVKEIQLGASLLGSFKYTRNLDDTSMSLSGSFEGAFTAVVVIPVTIGIKASLSLHDEAGSSNYRRSYTLETRPALNAAIQEGSENQNPTSAKELFDSIENFKLDLVYENGKYGDHVLGVPLLFKLAPIGDLFKHDQSPLYKILNEDILNKFSDMILTLHDFSGKGHVKSLIRSRDERLVAFFRINPEYPTLNPVAAIIVDWERGLAELAGCMKTSALDLFKKYKESKADINNILDSLREYETIFNAPQVMATLEEHVQTLKCLFNRVHIQDSAIAQTTQLFIMGKDELDNYLKEESSITKIVLQTGGTGMSSNGIFLRIYRLIPHLRSKLNIETKVAYSNIVDRFSLELKVADDHEQHTYELESIPFLLDILEAIIDPGTRKSLFFQVVSEIKEFRIDAVDIANNPSIIPDIINVFREQKDVLFAETYPQLWEFLSTNNGNWNIVLPVQGRNSAYDAVNSFLRVRKVLSTQGKIPFKYLVGSFDSNSPDTPLLLVFYGTELKAVCLDHFDCHILLNKLVNIDVTKTPENIDVFPILEPKLMGQYCLEPKRAEFIVNMLGFLSSTGGRNEVEVQQMPSFNYSRELTEPNLLSAIEIFRVASAKNIRSLLDFMGKLCVKENPTLAPILRIHSWTPDGGFNIPVGDLEPWRLLTEAVEEFTEGGPTELSEQDQRIIHLNELEGLIEAFSKAEDDSKVNYNIYNLCLNVIANVSLNVPQKEGLQNALEAKYIHKALCELANVRADDSLYNICRFFEESSFNLTNPKYMRKFVENMMDPTSFNLDEDNIRDIWLNPKIQYWLSLGIDDKSLIETICRKLAQNGTVPIYLPKLISDLVTGLLRENQTGAEIEYHWFRELSNVEDVVKAFQIIVTRGIIPASFATTLRDSLENNTALRAHMFAKDALFHWDNDKMLFREPWGVSTVYKSLLLLMASVGDPDTRELNLKTSVDNSTMMSPLSGRMEAKAIPVSGIWKTLSDGHIDFKTHISAQVLHEPFSSPVINRSSLNTTLSILIPYVIQQLSRKDVTALHPSRVISYIDYKGKNEDNGPVPRYMNQNVENIPFLLSRSDIITAVLNSSDALLVTQVFQTMANASMSLPLIVQDIRPSKQPTFRDYSELLKPLSILGMDHLLEETRLFREPYRFILAIRIGESPIGKSTFLNRTIMLDNHAFSSLLEPGLENGPPVSREGMVELSWISPFTVIPEAWEKFQRSPHSQELILIANVHGDALKKCQAVIEHLKPRTTSVLVFWKSSTWKEVEGYQKTLTALIGPQINQSHLFIDPDESIVSKVGDHNVLRSQELQLETTKFKIMNVVLEASRFKHESRLKADTIIGLTPVQLIPGIHTPASNALLDYVKTFDIADLKRSLKENENKEAIRLFNNILDLPLNKRLKSLKHISTELEYISGKESKHVMKKIIELQEDMKYLIEEDSTDKTHKMVELQNSIKRLQVAYDDLNLTTEAFIQAIWYLETTDFSPILDLFHAGYPTQLLSTTTTDSTNVMWSQLMANILCFSASERVFVVSVIGLQGSLKTTALNGVFGVNGFKVGPGGCTMGLHMQLLYISQNLVTEYGFHAVLLLDSEGLGSMETTPDPARLHSEVKLVTFLLGFSNLVLVMSNDDGIEQIVDTIEVSLLTMSRLTVNSLVPHILFLHQGVMEELGISDMMSNAIQRTMDIIYENNLELGLRSGSMVNLLGIKNRIASRNLVYKIQNSASPRDYENIYRLILETTNRSSRYSILSDWYVDSLQFWKELQLINGPLLLNSISKILNVINEHTCLNDVKTLIDKSFDYHYKLLKNELLITMDDDGLVDIGVFRQQISSIPNFCRSGIEESSCNSCTAASVAIESLSLPNKVSSTDLTNYTLNARVTLERVLLQIAVAQEIQTGNSTVLSETLDKILEAAENNNEEAWLMFQRYISNKKYVVPGIDQLEAEIRVKLRAFPHLEKCMPLTLLEIIDLGKFPALDTTVSSIELSPYNSHMSNKLSLEWSVWFIVQLEDLMADLIQEYNLDKYRTGLVSEVLSRVKIILDEFEHSRGVVLLYDFKYQVYIASFVCLAKDVKGLEEDWNKSYDPLQILISKFDKFPDLFTQGSSVSQMY